MHQIRNEVLISNGKCVSFQTTGVGIWDRLIMLEHNSKSIVILARSDNNMV